MSDTFTGNYNLVKPEVGASRDAWGSKWNGNADIIDAQLKAVADAAAAVPPGLPVGTMIEYAGTGVPPDYLRCDGAAFNRQDYAALYGVIGTTYGYGDGTNFRVPDTRGLFRRAIDYGRGVDPNRGPNTVQASQNLAHTHSLTGNGFIVQLYGSGPLVNIPGSADANSALHAVNIDVSGGNEARPINMAFPHLIKYR